MKKKHRHRIVLIATVIVIIGGIIGYNYNIEQIKIKGEIFSYEIKNIQDGLNRLQMKFEYTSESYREDIITKKEFLDMAENHFKDMEELILRYDNLSPPEPFISSVELFKLSTESQLKRDIQTTHWLNIGDEKYNIKADELHQESFAYELAALADFKAAQLGKIP